MYSSSLSFFAEIYQLEFRRKRLTALLVAALIEALKGVCVNEHCFRVVPQNCYFAPDTHILRVRGFCFLSFGKILFGKYCRRKYYETESRLSKVHSI